MVDDVSGGDVDPDLRSLGTQCGLPVRSWRTPSRSAPTCCCGRSCPWPASHGSEWSAQNKTKSQMKLIHKSTQILLE